MLRRKNSGFTLVEILIVVIILGILAAIVIPQFTDASTSAKQSGIQSQLQTLRSQIELYKMHHQDNLPDLITSWDQMIKRTNDQGSTMIASDETAYGPYLQAPPVNQLNNKSKVSNGTEATPGTLTDVGFVYDYDSGNGTGKIWAVNKDFTGLVPNP